ncbi:MAG: hypothetical protein IFK94_00690 [Acidobacteria bacterium]|uniref:Type II secretion system protein n=1 Tax=Candidatus Polarisedimenticola svalbardensis TaxID=2886004 RepID=A0A8J6XRS0_9BACT|nr:hypothetical protein [Candidatus Polarisedimenticola svalbardensis]
MNVRPARKSEHGHLMVGLVFFMAVLMILSAVAVQEFSQILRRDNEAEMIFRAQEIVRALVRYQKDRGGYPTELEMLNEPGNQNQRFIRRMYDDPLTKDGKWGLLYAGPGGGIIDPSRPVAGAADIIGERTSGQTQSTGGMQSGFGGGAQEIGGLQIAGVKSLCTDTPFRVWNGLSDYSEWQFTVYDLQNQQKGGTALPQAGQSRNQNLAPGGRQRGNAPGQQQGRGSRRDRGRQR